LHTWWILSGSPDDSGQPANILVGSLSAMNVSTQGGNQALSTNQSMVRGVSEPTGIVGLAGGSGAVKTSVPAGSASPASRGSVGRGTTLMLKKMLNFIII